MARSEPNLSPPNVDRAGDGVVRSGKWAHIACSPWQVALVILLHARIYAGVLGPCLGRLAYMSHVVLSHVGAPRGASGWRTCDAMALTLSRSW
jgi:hypothetical protein